MARPSPTACTPGTRHACFNDTRANDDVDASRDAWARTLTFFVSLG